MTAALEEDPHTNPYGNNHIMSTDSDPNVKADPSHSRAVSSTSTTTLGRVTRSLTAKAKAAKEAGSVAAGSVSAGWQTINRLHFTHRPVLHTSCREYIFICCNCVSCVFLAVTESSPAKLHKRVQSRAETLPRVGGQF